MNRTTESHRKECEARWILAQEFGNRRPYLDLVGKKRGEAAMKELENEVKRQHRLAKAAA